MTFEDKISVQPQLQNDGAKIATLVRQTIHGAHGRPGLGFMASKQPIAVIIATTSACQIISLHESAPQLIDDEKIRREINAFASGETAL